MLDARVLVVQWSGDYREAYERLRAGGGEDYYAQRHSIETAGELARECRAYGVLCLTGSTRFDERLPNGVHAMGAGGSAAASLEAIEAFEPSHLVITTPQQRLIDWALRHRVQLLPMFADTFTRPRGGRSLRALGRRVKHDLSCRRLARTLNDPRIRWVGNHNVGASRDLVRIGVIPGKVIPWDWPPVVRADDHEPKTIRPDLASWNLVLVGTMTPSKGVGDAVAAVGELRRRGRPATLRLFGRGDVAAFRAHASEHVVFEGPRSHADVVAAVRSAHLALVPSWHEYPEGLPMTIYEGLATRTPVVCSDHPAFRDRVGDGVATVTVPQKSPMALADAVDRLMTDPARYARMSIATEAVWKRLLCPVTYYELIRRWVSSTAADDAWLGNYSVVSSIYG